MKQIPPVTRALLLINVGCYLLQLIFAKTTGIDLADQLGLHFVLASAFNPLQLVTYMFLHGSLTHLFFNMFSLWMFGGIIERTLGVKRFLIYYFICGIGAGLCQEAFQTAQYFIEGLGGYEMVNTGSALIPMSTFLNSWTTIGASGACYGVLLAFGMLYPNERLMLLIPPIPMKAKYFVAGYAAIELFSAYASNDNVAHFAHLGGMLFGWLLLFIWRRKAQRSAQPRWGGGAPKGPTFGERLRSMFGRRPVTTAGNAHRAPYRETPHQETDREYNERKAAEEARMDEILDKVSRSGYDSLTTEEKRELFRISRK